MMQLTYVCNFRKCQKCQRVPHTLFFFFFDLAENKCPVKVDYNLHPLPKLLVLEKINLMLLM